MFPFLKDTLLACIALLLTWALRQRITYFILSRRYAKLHNCGPVKVLHLWDIILGFDFIITQVRASLENRLLQDIQDRFSRVGRTFAANVLGDVLIFTDEPKNTHAILSTKFQDFDVGRLRHECAARLFGRGIFMRDGASWQHARALIRPNLTKQQITDLKTLEQRVQQMISQLPANGVPLDIQPYFFRLTLDTATERLFGRSVESLRNDANEESQRFASAFDFALSVVAQKIRLGKLNWAYQSRKYNKACKIVHDYVRPVVADAVRFRVGLADDTRTDVSKIATPLHAKLDSSDVKAPRSRLESIHAQADPPVGAEKCYVFLKELAKETGDEKELRDQVINMLIAGRDTTASLMSSTLFVISRRPDLWCRLKEEVAFLQGKPPTLDQIHDIKYLRYILNETLRLYPVAPINARVANKDTSLPCGGGPRNDDPIFVKQGQMVIWSVYSMHKRQDLWGHDAVEFIPERWESKHYGINYLPFNEGPRVCPGKYLALTEASYTLIRLCQTFRKIEVVRGQEEEPWTESLNLSCAVSGGVHVRCWR